MIGRKLRGGCTAFTIVGVFVYFVSLPPFELYLLKQNQIELKCQVKEVKVSTKITLRRRKLAMLTAS